MVSKYLRMKADFVPLVGEYLSEHPYPKAKILIPKIYPNNLKSIINNLKPTSEILVRNELGELDKAGYSNISESYKLSEILKNAPGIDSFIALKYHLLAKETSKDNTNLMRFFRYLVGVEDDEKSQRACETFMNNMTYSFWEFIPGFNRTLYFDSVSNKFFAATSHPDILKIGTQIFQDGKKINDYTMKETSVFADKSIVDPSLILDQFNSLEDSLIALDELPRHILNSTPYKKLFPRSTRLMLEVQTTLEGDNYLLQVTPIHDKTYSLDDSLSIGKFTPSGKKIPVHMNIGRIPNEDSVIEVMMLPYEERDRRNKLGSFTGEGDNSAFFGDYHDDNSAEVELLSTQFDGCFIDSRVTDLDGEPDFVRFFSGDGNKHPQTSQMFKPSFSCITPWYKLFDSSEFDDIMMTLTGQRFKENNQIAEPVHIYTNLSKEGDKLYVNRLLPKKVI